MMLTYLTSNLHANRIKAGKQCLSVGLIFVLTFILPHKILAQAGGDIINLTEEQTLIQPFITFQPDDAKQYQELIFRRDALTAPKVESDTRRSNFSVSAARQRLSQRDDELRIGIILPEKKLEKLVELMHYAAQMAFFDYGTQDAKLFFYDIGDDDQQAKEVIKQATRDSVDIILGPLFADSVTKLAPYAGANGLPMISFSNSEKVAEQGAYVFGLTPSQQAKQIINYAIANKSKKIAIFTPENDYGRLVANTAKAELEKHNIGLSYLTFYDEASTDLSQQVRQFTHYDYRKLRLNLYKNDITDALKANDAKQIDAMVKIINRQVGRKIRKIYNTLSPRNILKSELKRLSDVDTLGKAPFDSILVVVGSSRILQTIVSLFAFYDLSARNVDIYGLQLWDEMRSLKNDDTLIGARHISIDSQRYQDFVTRYRELFGKTPPTLVSLVYDATILALTANKDGKIDPSNLQLANGYSGVGSHFRFLETGIVERLYGIKQVNGKKSRVIQAAPKIFPRNY